MFCVRNNLCIFRNNLPIFSNFLQINVRCCSLNASSNLNESNIANYELPVKEQNKLQQDKLSKQKSLHVAIIGVPNAGKSTFINNLINHRVCPTSSKVHTTRKSNKAILTSGDTQLVLSDTPGLVTPNEIKKHHLEKSFMSAYRHAIQNSDVIAVMHDVSNAWTRNQLHTTVLETLKTYPHLPSCLILNKIDALKSKRILLDVIRLLTNGTLSAKAAKMPALSRHAQKYQPKTKHKEAEAGWSSFADVFMVSSITGNGLTDLQDYFVKNAKPRNWSYAGDCFTDETPEALVEDSVRARLLDYLPQEIPYMLKTSIEFFSIEKNTIYASVKVTCPSARIERLICGQSNGRLRQITERVTSDLVETFGKPISLTIATISERKSEDEKQQH